MAAEPYLFQLACKSTPPPSPLSCLGGGRSCWLGWCHEQRGRAQPPRHALFGGLILAAPAHAFPVDMVIVLGFEIARVSTFAFVASKCAGSADELILSLEDRVRPIVLHGGGDHAVDPDHQLVGALAVDHVALLGTVALAEVGDLADDHGEAVHDAARVGARSVGLRQEQRVALLIGNGLDIPFDVGALDAAGILDLLGQGGAGAQADHNERGEERN